MQSYEFALGCGPFCKLVIIDQTLVVSQLARIEKINRTFYLLSKKKKELELRAGFL